jgi:hypothetical protein
MTGFLTILFMVRCHRSAIDKISLVWLIIGNLYPSVSGAAKYIFYDIGLGRSRYISEADSDIPWDRKAIPQNVIRL